MNLLTTYYTVRISFTLNLETAVDKTIPPQGPFGSFSGAFDCIAQFSSADGVLIPFDYHPCDEVKSSMAAAKWTLR